MMLDRVRTAPNLHALRVGTRMEDMQVRRLSQRIDKDHFPSWFSALRSRVVEYVHRLVTPGPPDKFVASSIIIDLSR